MHVVDAVLLASPPCTPMWKVLEGEDPENISTLSEVVYSLYVRSFGLSVLLLA